MSYRNDNGKTALMVSELKSHIEKMVLAVEKKEFSASTGTIVIDMLIEQHAAIAKTGANCDVILPLIETFKAAKQRINAVYITDN